MKFLKKLREKRGLTFYGAAKKLGMIQQSYIHLENKAQGVKMKNLVAIKKEYNLSWDELGKLIEDEFD